MKCVCGYEYEEDYINGVRNIVKGDELFMKLECQITSKECGKVYLYSCPKCRTVHVQYPQWYDNELKK